MRLVLPNLLACLVGYPVRLGRVGLDLRWTWGRAGFRIAWIAKTEKKKKKRKEKEKNS